MTPRPATAVLLLAAALTMAGCGKPKPPKNFIAPASGSATVLSAETGLFEVTLQTDDGVRQAYWTKDSFFFRGQAQLTDYYPAKGTQIVYKGIVTGRDLLLTHVWVIKD